MKDWDSEEIVATIFVIMCGTIALVVAATLAMG